MAAAALMAGLAASPAVARDTSHPELIPARLLECTLGHATNFDPEQQQTVDDITFDTHHRISLFLPASARRKSPPPDALEKPETVDPATRIVDDPDGIAADAPGQFERVVDLWPDRVELAKPTVRGAFKTFLISDYEPDRATARLFLGTAADLTTYDLKRIYMGACRVILHHSKRRRIG